MVETRRRVDLDRIQGRLGAASGREYWRNLKEFAESEEFGDLLQREFPRQAAAMGEVVNRREFLTIMAASLALAGLTGCSAAPPSEKIFPYVRPPEDVIPGEALYFATAMPMAGYAMGIMAESHMGRPTKIEGNPSHPASLGATDVFAQASVLTLYDPDRSQVVTHYERISTWDSFITSVTTDLEKLQLNGGTGLRILTGTVTSPTLASQLTNLLQQYPSAKWHRFEPVNCDNARAGSRLVFGQYVDVQYRFDQADVIVSLDSDFLYWEQGRLAYARQFASRRKGPAGTGMNRLYVVESMPSITGAIADHRIPLRSSEIERIVRVIAARVGAVPEATVGAGADSNTEEWLEALIDDLKQHPGSSIVLAGNQQSAIVHALTHVLNERLGNSGKTVFYTNPVEANPAEHGTSLADLVQDMKAGSVEVLVIIGGNPVYTAPADLDFAKYASSVPTRIHMGLYEDETSAISHWHIPEAHFLETWADARAYEGTATILQPLISPLYNGRSAYELLSALLGKPGRSGYDIIREFWQSQKPGGDFEHFWRKAVHDGVVPNSAEPTITVSPRLPSIEPRQENLDSKGSLESLELVFRPHPNVYDGRFANNAWLQEIPAPFTKLTWDNAALISPATAQEVGVSNEDVIEIASDALRVRAPAWIVPGHADRSVTVHLGYGRSRAGQVGSGRGFNAYAIRNSSQQWITTGVRLNKTQERYPLVSTQQHHHMEGRALVRAVSAQEYAANPRVFEEMGEGTPREYSLYPRYPKDPYSWGMSIDLSTCIGCNACVVACQSENNIPTVGKEEVGRGREMHWLRIDEYFKGTPSDPETLFQPMLCQHCENAPCELVCPVGATTHSAEGLNEMTYNRCVGTRYCSNNCPYKVRRFNFFEFADFVTPSLKLQRNPNVTVRSRGVMEKCTYCVQRINKARIQSQKEDRLIKDGEIVTACQAACPTEAIVFGNVADNESRVSKLKAEPRDYGVLAELNTQPRTTYLGKLRNPNPRLA